MTAAYDPELVARLAREAREDDERMTPGPWKQLGRHGEVMSESPGSSRHYETTPVTAIPDYAGNLACIARTRNNLRATADQLEAMQAIASRYDDDLQMMRATEADLQHNRRRADEAEHQLEAAQARIAELEATVECEHRLACETSDVIAELEQSIEARLAEVLEREAARERERDAAVERIAKLEETARAAAENWMAACRERDEARVEVERLNATLEVWAFLSRRFAAADKAYADSNHPDYAETFCERMEEYDATKEELCALARRTAAERSE